MQDSKKFPPPHVNYPPYSPANADSILLEKIVIRHDQ